MSKQIVYQFDVKTPTGAGVVKVPLSDCTQCPCGCSVYKQVFRTAFVRPQGMFLQEPMQFTAAILICDECHRELDKADGKVGVKPQIEADTNGS